MATFMVSGDIRTAFTLEVEAESEEAALAAVQDMSAEDIEMSASLASADVVLDYAEPAD